MTLAIAGLNHSSLRTLTDWEAPLVVSAFVPVDFSKPQAAEALEKALRHVVQTVTNALTDEHGMEAAEVAALVARLVPATLIDQIPHSTRGLALFASPDRAEQIAAPIALGPAVEIGQQVDLLRLLPALVDDIDYYALTIDKKGAQLFRGSRFEFEVVPVPEMPGSIDEALWYIHREPLHGIGGSEDLRKDDVRQYIHLIDKAVAPVLNGSEAPLVVIGVEYEAAMFINHTHYRHTGDIAITGSPESMSAEELHRRSWDFVESKAQSVGDAVERLHRLAGTGKTATDVDEVVTAGRDGAVQDLLLARSLTEDADPPRRPTQARQHIVTAVNEALRHRAAIHLVDDAEAGSAGIAAVLRY